MTRQHADENLLQPDFVEGPKAPAVGAATMDRGVAVGRYVLIQELGKGGMGVVYLAYDPDLQRRVAVKFFELAQQSPTHFAVSDRTAPDPIADRLAASAVSSTNVEHFKLMLLQEARAAAKIADPHVVAVYDVGIYGDRIFLAMEYVTGPTLRRSLTPLPTRVQVVAWLRQCLLGLDAVHHAGLVHADFKPDNVILSDDGLVKILDFGLAQVLSQAPKQRAAKLSCAGTPSYLAPEIRRGDAPSVRSDLFAWAVSAYECLCGARPFASDGRSHRFAGQPWQRHVLYLKQPLWLRELIERCLADDPMQRPASAQAVIEALDFGFAQRERNVRGMLATTALLCSFALGGIGVQTLVDQRDCDIPETGLLELWNRERSHAVGQAFSQSQSPLASASAPRIDELIRAWQGQWREAYADACAARATGSSLAMLAFDREVGCLRQALTRVDQIATSFAHADARLVERSVAIIEALDPPQQCLNDHQAPAQLSWPDDPLRRKEAQEFHRELESVANLLTLGRGDEAKHKLTALQSGLAPLDWLPLQVRALELASRLHYSAWDYDTTEDLARKSYLAQRALGQQAGSFRALTMLFMATSYNQPSRDEATEVGRLIDAFAHRDHRDRRALINAYGQLGAVLINVGLNVEAERALLVALELLQRDGRAQPALLATLLANLSGARNEDGRPEQGESDARSSLAYAQMVFGANHPELGRSLYNLAAALNRQGRFREGAEVAQRGQDILEAAAGKWTPRAVPHYHYGLDALNGMGRYSEALQLYPQVLAIFATTFGAESLRAQSLIGDWADTAFAAGDHVLAQQLLDRVDRPGANESTIVGLDVKFARLAAWLALARNDAKEAQRIVMSRLHDHSHAELLVAGPYALGTPAVYAAVALELDDRPTLSAIVNAIDPARMALGVLPIERTFAPLFRATVRLGDLDRAQRLLDHATAWVERAQVVDDPRQRSLKFLRAELEAALGHRQKAQLLRDQAYELATPIEQMTLARLQQPPWSAALIP